ncbi:E3 ubiquitin-protein ligase COP1-like isoform X2 [Camellia sinensis]|uniref:E3 ubiquitin-protein ligase COP1-like isoform X2 n=1 Tax=Camellia sinensis TaxID=4442 RepID=UPI001036C68B|nr:E3 ubiquitin-protein ligase COP1-like isoform X2 [Camellia sinensis]
MGDSSMGVLVPSVKSEPMSSDAVAAPLPPPETTAAAAELDKDFLCPICMQIIKDAFLTACGHSFCYMCIVTHLRNKSDCPCCSHYLTTNHLFPNFLLNKLLKETSARQIAKTASPFKQLHHALQQGCDVSVKELDSLLTLLEEKKRKIEQEEAETNMQILLDFLHCLRKQKLEELNEIQTDLQYIKEDINAVERHRIDLYRAKERYSVKLRMLLDDPSATKAWPSLMDRRRCGILSSIPPSPQGLCWMNEGNSQNRKVDGKALVSSQMVQRKDSYSGPDSHVTQSGLAVARKRRVHAQFNDLQECYLQRRRHWVRQSYKQEERDTNAMNREGYHAGLEDFQSVLSTFTRYSIEFDRDDELFATAGVSRRIKVFEFSSLVNESVDVQFPVVEMSTRSKLSCLSWSKCTKNHIASSDYEGIVTVWDVTTRQSVMEYEEHEKRAWSVDFSRTEPSMLVSGSDDCKVKIWCTNQEASVLDIDMKANICSVKYNPGSSFYVAVGSADHHVHYYDLRNVSQPLHVFSGHRKAVSYVKFLSSNELASASTDSTLRLWDVKENLPLRTFRGHTNEKNFVGLTVNSEYIACGSETNDVFVYHKAISRPAAWHRFASSDLDDVDDDAGSYFISAVCWKSDSPTMLAANSQGTIKALVLAA